MEEKHGVRIGGRGCPGFCALSGTLPLHGFTCLDACSLSLLAVSEVFFKSHYVGMAG